MAFDSTPREFIDAEIRVGGLNSPTDEKTLLDLIQAREGVREAQFARGRLELEYDPLLVHKTQLVELITKAGFRVEEVESAPASLIVDAILTEQPPPVS